MSAQAHEVDAKTTELFTIFCNFLRSFRTCMEEIASKPSLAAACHCRAQCASPSPAPSPDISSPLQVGSADSSFDNWPTTLELEVNDTPDLCCSPLRGQYIEMIVHADHA